MEYPVLDGSLEIRARGDGKRVLSGSFPLGRTATVRSSGRVRKERFARGRGGASVSWQVRKFQELQEELSRTISATIDQTRKEMLIEQLEDALEKRNTHLLVGHSYDKAIADMRAGNLTLTFSDDAVAFAADLPDEEAMPSWIRDAVLAVEGGQLRGVSPGFQVPSKGAEKLIPEPGNTEGVMIREILDSVVYEYSLVSRPAYSGTSVSAREDDPLIKPRRSRMWL